MSASAEPIREQKAKPEKPSTSRRRARARSRALNRLAREFAARYRQLYSEELGAS
jgi:hypothetical protein